MSKSPRETWLPAEPIVIEKRKRNRFGKRSKKFFPLETCPHCSKKIRNIKRHIKNVHPKEMLKTNGPHEMPPLSGRKISGYIPPVPVLEMKVAPPQSKDQ